MLRKSVLIIGSSLFFCSLFSQKIDLTMAGVIVELQDGSAIRKVRDFIIYRDSSFYAAFPSVIKKPDGELLLAFRRAPDRKVFGEKSTNHVDPNSYLVSMISPDLADTWSSAKLFYAHTFGGSQDPCLLQVSDGSILCTSYGWAFVRPDGLPNLKTPYAAAGDGVIFLGGYTISSQDGGDSWEGPLFPRSVPSEVRISALGDALPAYNRGALSEGKNGVIYWAVAVSENGAAVGRTSVHLLTSNDQGQHWEYSCKVAGDQEASFNETSIYETPKGDLVAFLRTANMDDEACIARSTDGGKSFQQWEGMGFQGHPLQATRLPDNRVFLVYGYRHKPYGIRARILNAECTDYQTSEEIILREDGGSTDLGYPWSVMLNEKNILVTYYFNLENGPRYIGGSLLELDNK
jgi:hypothetical protein